ncbi:MAG: hypothetical protein IKJ38_07920 [Alistipes sp.]|nr:hypothetical protein [Alistipes sp.]
MNKKTITRLFSVVAVALMGVGCQADYFNEAYLPDYENDGTIVNVRDLEMTLTGDDYAAIAKNATNKALAEAEGEDAVDALADIGKNKYFSCVEEAALYVPAFIDNLYPTLDSNSTALVTYTFATDVPTDVTLMNVPVEYTLTKEDYQTIWGSEEDYAEAITPKTNNKLAGVLPVSDDARVGEYMVVTYNYSDEEPEAPTTPENPGTPEEPAAGYTSVLGTAKKDDVVEVRGYISAVCTQGPILTDNGGSVLLYKTQDLALGDEVTVSGTIGVFNNGLQIGTDGISIEKTGTTTVTYPEPMVIDGAKADEVLTTHTGEGFCFTAQYAKMVGNVTISTSSDGTKTYYNVAIPGAEAAKGSIYGITPEMAAQLESEKDYTLYGYFISISRSGGTPTFVNIVLTSVEPADAPTPSRMALKVKSQKRYAFFKLEEGGKYRAADIVAIQPADYTAMGQSYGNFTNPAQDRYIPLYLAQNYPYAQDGDKLYVGYICRANDTNSWRVDEYVFEGTWTKTEYFASKTDQFRKTAGEWAIDPTLELDFTGKTAETQAFYQYCCNWVYDNKDVPLGAPARDNDGVIISTDIVLINGEKPKGDFWVSNYGNNEFYTGSSAYYGNMDWRPAACRGGFTAAGMGDLSDDEILAKLKENTCEVFAAVLGYVYPEMTADEYKKVIIKVYAYGPNKNYSLAFEVVDKGTFEFIDGSLTEL